MDKELLDFINNNTGVITLYTRIEREITSDGREHIAVYPIGENGALYSFWRNPNKPDSDTTPVPKHAGGKKPYIMLMVDEVEKLRAAGVKNSEEMIGYLVCMGKYVEWNTGRLINKRNKKPMQYQELQKAFGCGNKKFNKMLASMKKCNLLHKNEEGYFISPQFIKKGQTNKKEGV